MLECVISKYLAMYALAGIQTCIFVFQRVHNGPAVKKQKVYLSDFDPAFFKRENFDTYNLNYPKILDLIDTEIAQCHLLKGNH